MSDQKREAQVTCDEGVECFCKVAGGTPDSEFGSSTTEASQVEESEGEFDFRTARLRSFRDCSRVATTKPEDTRICSRKSQWKRPIYIKFELQGK